LPDILVLVFSANEQSFERGVQVATGIQKARRELAVPRPPLAVLPVPGRFDGRDEVDDARVWLKRFAQDLRPFYDDWLPKGLEPRQILELTKIPYITKFSFGEPLPVITQGVSDPEFPGFYLENITRLLVSDFQDAQLIVAPESVEQSRKITELRSLLAGSSVDEKAVAQVIAEIESESGATLKLFELLAETGSFLFRHQRWGAAESYFRRSLKIGVDTLGMSHPFVRSSMRSLAEILSASGRREEAESVYRRLVEQNVDTDSASLADYTNLANICREMGRREEAVHWYERVVYMAERTERSNDPTTIAAYNNLAAVYREMGRHEEAISWYERALYTAERVGRPDDPAAMATYSNLASTYREMGRREEAVRWYERALDTAERAGRSDDPQMMATYNNLASVYREMGRYEEAIRWYERALGTSKGAGRRDDSATMATYTTWRQCTGKWVSWRKRLGGMNACCKRQKGPAGRMIL
jgi:tetratricopeptide (TPR) repeat protein